MSATRSFSPHRSTANPQRPNQVRKSCRHPSRYRLTNTGSRGNTVVKLNRSEIPPRLSARDSRRLRRHAKQQTPTRKATRVSLLTDRETQRVSTDYTGIELASARPALSATTSSNVWRSQPGLPRPSRVDNLLAPTAPGALELRPKSGEHVCFKRPARGIRGTPRPARLMQVRVRQ